MALKTIPTWQGLSTLFQVLNKEIIMMKVIETIANYLKRHRQYIIVSVIVTIWYVSLHMLFIYSSNVAPMHNPDLPHRDLTLLETPSYYDGGYYLDIAQYGYHKAGSERNIAFYPLYPMLLRVTHKLTFGILNYNQIAFAANYIFTLITALLILKIGNLLYIRKYWLPVVLWLSFPWAIFLGALYTEALFCMLTALFFYNLMLKKYLSAAFFAGLASATRLPGVILAIVLVGQTLIENGWGVYLKNWRPIINKPSKWLISLANISAFGLLASSGILLWLGYQWVSFGSPLAFRHAYETGWSFQKFNLNIPNTIYIWFVKSFKQLHNLNTGNSVFELGALLLVIGSVVISYYKKIAVPKIWTVYLLLNSLLFTINSNLVSVNRYVLPLLPIYFIVSIFYQRSSNKYKSYILASAVTLSVFAQIIVGRYYANQFWIG